ncbi:hypothetical protein FRB96_005812 [Tulasnella sp. 330]|nr:hypothetical protein FRB96_005812 [Tulasnella sp. 330]KAG8881535.1 hypothetical protein FRB98_004274 [Tulasnella sp. 332]
MHSSCQIAALFVAALCYTNVFGAPLLLRREVPQEHSHEQFLTSVRASLNLNNPDEIQDPVFGLLGSAAAAAGQGKITDTDCLHQATADQAFTNAKAAGDITAMTDALIYAALERNTGSVGQASVLCTSIKAVNPEVAAITQHQDPASPGAAAGNKAVALELAKQIASFGGDPQQAIKSGTFAPGTIGDPTAKGNTCDDQNDPVGCIFTQNLLVPDVTAAEIDAAVSGVASTASATTAVTADPTVTDTASASAVATDAASTTDTASASIASVAATSTFDFGSCSNPTIEFAVGLDGRTGGSFEAVNQGDFPHNSALNIGIITAFICDRFNSPCKASAATISACDGFSNALNGRTDAAAADEWNADFGFSTNFANGATTVAATTAAATTAAAATASTDVVTTTATGAASTVSIASVAAGSLDFGSCSNPTIEFVAGLDNRGTAFSFEPVNQADFSHDSALNIGIITSFMCDRLNDPCKASATTLDICGRISTSLNGRKDGDAADEFNAALGFTTHFGNGTTTAAATTAAAATTVAVAVVASETTTTTAAASTVASGTSGAIPPTFTGALGGVPLPPITPSGDKFLVNGQLLNSLSAAQERACDVQNNQCADASNAAGNTKTFSVADCNMQQAACDAANSAASANAAPATAATTTAAAVAVASEVTTASAATSTVASGTSSAISPTFTGALGGVPLPPITPSGDKFLVNGQLLNSLSAARERACDVQNNQCADASNAAGNTKTFSVGDCNTQQAACDAASA